MDQIKWNTLVCSFLKRFFSSSLTLQCGCEFDGASCRLLLRPSFSILDMLLSLLRTCCICPKRSRHHARIVQWFLRVWRRSWRYCYFFRQLRKGIWVRRWNRRFFRPTPIRCWILWIYRRHSRKLQLRIGCWIQLELVRSKCTRRTCIRNIFMGFGHRSSFDVFRMAA